MKEFFWYVGIMMGVTYLIRAVPFTLFRRKVQNRFFRSFLRYVPYTVLTAMTVPAMFFETSFPVAAIGFLTAVFLAYRGKGLVTVALAACSSGLLIMLMQHFL